MQAEIISIGDELLIGQTVNTNASWLGSALAKIGIPVKWGVTIADDKQAIIDAAEQAMERSELVIMTGGLGPTKDDITKHTLCEYFETELEINHEALQRITAYFESRGRKMLDVNVQQAALPKACKVIHNFHGTACGMWFEKGKSVLVSLPGVPYEMKGMMEDFLLEAFQLKFNVSSLFHKTILLTGIGESYLADQMADWENRTALAGLSLAYLPSPGIVKLRLTSRRGEVDESLIDRFFDEMEATLPYHVFGYEKAELNAVVGELLTARKQTVGTVESCTGGGVANALVSIPGASNYFMGSFVTYSNAHKIKMVGVKQQTLDRYGAVSKETAEEMAQGGLHALGVEYCVATTGIAGPDGGTVEKPVGTVWISVATKEKVVSKQFNFGDNRERNIQMTIFAGLNLLRCVVLDIYSEKK
ncbi:MAG: competence/damage-inducible protein A [Crocinitomicaceae bacterium]|nr:MAG: competence/damage-inducible protein A [Crocinitomicaceae bacterium]